jgi:hypothetical protein
LEDSFLQASSYSANNALSSYAARRNLDVRKPPGWLATGGGRQCFTLPGFNGKMGAESAVISEF